MEEIKNQLQKIKDDIERKEIEIAKIEREMVKYRGKTSLLLNSIPDEMKELMIGEEFVKFWKEPYSIIKNSRNSWLVSVAKYVKNFQVGWLHNETDTHYIYEINHYSVRLGDVPQNILDKIGYEKSFNGSIKGDVLFFNPTDKHKLKRKFGDHLRKIKETQATIVKGHEFDVIAEIVKSGGSPFQKRKVTESDCRLPESKIKLRKYQKEAVDKFLECGAVGVFHPTGAGKSFISLHLLDILEGEKLIIVPSRTLIEQWNYYLSENLSEERRNEVTISTYQGCGKLRKNKYMLVIYDEAQRLPANSFSKLSLLNTKYRIGLSASPHREDGRENYIFALTGFPIGLNWKEYMKNRNKKYHSINVHIVPTEKHKKRKTEDLLEEKRKTLIFCDSISLGAELSRKLDIPHIHGSTQNRMEIIQENQHVVISRVGDLGISVKDLERIIEVDFLFGSRQQQLQRTGRLMHSIKKDLRHDIIMTEDEYEKYKKRLWALKDKGFDLKFLKE